ncbi:hypothetical protein ACFO0M_10570 [Micromonospora mangrovi]|uniref:Uncharacterized protein n=2 Tax=Micromonospora TaxID=1873 RepID=A0AAU8HDY1_9ACTN
MPAPVALAEKRSPALLTVLFWIGVGLAPLAALILLVADGNGTLRFGAVLAILAVVLIGLSVALRADGGGPARSGELADEIEQLRRELRAEIVAAAQRGNQALDQAQRAEDSITAMRRRLDAVATGIAAAAGITAPAADEAAGGRARVPAPEAYDEAGSRGRYAAPDEAGSRGRYAAPDESGWGQPAAERRDDDEAVRRPQPGGRYGTAQPTGPAQPGVYGAPAQPGQYGPATQPGQYGAPAQAGVYGAARPAEQDVRPEPGPRPVGVVHHTETVHVTTRHTIVDGAGADPAANRYGRWSPAPEERSWGAAEADERPRVGYGDDRGRSGEARSGQHDRSWSAGTPDDRSWPGQHDDRSWPGEHDDRPRPAQGAARVSRSWSAPADDRAGHDESRSWSVAPDERAARDDRWSGGDEPSWAGQAWGPADGRSWEGPDPSAPATDDPEGEYWSQLRTGDRWASVREDEHGREVRVGERRAAVHADGAGTEYRVEDRWASVRQAEPRREPERDDDGWAGEGRPALPVGGVPVPDEWRPPRQRGAEPQWRTSEPEPVRYGQPRGGDERYGYPPRDEVPRAGGARSSDRWR